MELHIKQDEKGSKGAFFIEQDGKRLAEMTYSIASEHLIIIDHTEVSDALRGTGAGKKLLMQAVEYARANQIKIMPLCPFAKSVFDKDENIRDVLK